VNEAAADISLVIPTYNRAAALRANLANMLDLEGILEVVIVDDGSSDDTAEVCRGAGDERLHLVSHPRNRGVAAARNTGVEHATGAWVLFGEDDCRFPPDYALVLRQVAERESADIVGAPLLRVFHDGLDPAEVAARAARTRRSPTMDDDSVFPLTTISTPFLPARVLVRRSVFDRVSFYDRYPGNAYREETDFFVQAVRAGFRCLLTPDTYCYQLDNWSGGQHHSSRLRYEYWTIRNNWTFLGRHGAWLAEQGYIRGPVTQQARFILGRVLGNAHGMARARIHRLRAARADAGG
jgi:GT2 family glycosyltransferase